MQLVTFIPTYTWQNVPRNVAPIEHEDELLKQTPVGGTLQMKIPNDWVLELESVRKDGAAVKVRLHVRKDEEIRELLDDARAQLGMPNAELHLVSPKLRRRISADLTVEAADLFKTRPRLVLGAQAVSIDIDALIEKLRREKLKKPRSGLRAVFHEMEDIDRRTTPNCSRTECLAEK